MAATLVPIICSCGQTVCYEIRAGVVHQRVETYDPYEVAGVLKKEPGGWVIGPLAGELYHGFVGDLRAALKRAKIKKVRWERAKDYGLKKVTEIVAKGTKHA